MVPHSRVWLANGIFVRSFVADRIPVALYLWCLWCWNASESNTQWATRSSTDGRWPDWKWCTLIFTRSTVIALHLPGWVPSWTYAFGSVVRWEICTRDWCLWGSGNVLLTLWSGSYLWIVPADHRNASDGSSLTVCPMGGMFILFGMKSSMYWIGESLQPFNAQYIWANTSANLIIPDPEVTILNPYKGGVFQQATSGVTETSRFYVHCWYSPFIYIYIYFQRSTMLWTRARLLLCLWIWVQARYVLCNSFRSTMYESCGT